MKNLLNPWWAIGVVTIPHLILFTLFFSSYQIIKSLLTPENILYWTNYGIALSIINIFSIIYAVFCWKNKRDLHTSFGLFILIAHGVFLYFFMYQYNSIIPNNIPNWMFMEGDLGLYVYTFLMPSMAYGLFLWVLYFTPNVYKIDIKFDFLMLFFIPLGCYFAVTAFPLWHYVALGGEFFRHLVALLFMGGVVVFLFFLTRVFYVYIARQDNRFREMRLVWQIIFLIICPLLGLALNNESFNFIFGDFSNPIVYVLAFCNGALLCVPAFENKYGRLLLFVLRSIGFTYIIYFFIVFLPFLPLAIPAMILWGLGILMLMPLVNFIVQGHTLSEDFAYLQRSWSVFLLTPLFVASLAVLPASFWITCLEDDENLRIALDYLYEPDYKKEAPKINLASLKRTIENVAYTKQRRNNDMILSEGKANSLTCLLFIVGKCWIILLFQTIKSTISGKYS